MTVYVDDMELRHGGQIWCHMATDGDLSELHDMAQRIGLRREWFQDHPGHPHYDLVPSKQLLALKHGAVKVSMTQLFEVCFEEQGDL